MGRFRHKGFTLIELMVVLVIMGVMVSFAVLSIGDGGNHDRLMEQARRLSALIDMASDQAVLEGREWGMRIQPDGYQFMVMVDGKWQDAGKDNLFRERKMENGFSLELHVDDVAVSLDQPADNDDSAKDKELSPQVYLMSSAERTPFKVVITSPVKSSAMVVEVPMTGKAVFHDKT